MQTQIATAQRQIFYIKPNVPTDKAKLKVAGYARVSSNSHDQLNSFFAQVNYYTKLIEQNSEWEFVEVYADESVSGTTIEKREDFNRMIDDCRKGKIDRIITKSSSRFSRNTLDSISTVRELKSMGVSVYFEKENIDTAKLSGENLLTLYMIFAQQESVSISQNCKRSNRMRMKNGTYISSNTPYGYRLANGELEIYEPEAEVIRRIFKDYLSGFSTKRIANALTTDKIPRKNGDYNWKSNLIALILKNERYKGAMLLQKSFNEDSPPYRKRINHGDMPKYYVKDTHAPIVTEMQFELANILLDTRSSYVHNACEEYPLSKKIRCKVCGTLYRRKVSRGKIYWACRNHDIDKSYCKAERFTEEKAYDAFIRMYNKLSINRNTILVPMLSHLKELREYITRDNIEINTINKQIAELSEQNHVMNGLLESGILDSALFISQCDELSKKLRNLKQAKTKLLSDNEQNEDIEKTEEIFDVLNNSPKHLVEFDASIFEQLVSKITADGSDGIEFELINGLVLKERL